MSDAPSTTPGQKELEKVEVGGGLFARPAAPEQTVLLKKLEFDVLCRGAQVPLEENLWVFCFGILLAGVSAIGGLLCSTDVEGKDGKPNWWAIGWMIGYLVMTATAFVCGIVCFIRSRAGKTDPVYKQVRERIACDFQPPGGAPPRA